VGDYRPEHIFTLKQSLTAYRHYQKLIADCDQEVQQRVEAFQSNDDGPTAAADSSSATSPTAPSFDLHSHLERIFGVDLTAIPGFDVLRIQTIFSELGADMSPFPTDDTFCSWLNVCPKDGTSAGRRIRARKAITKNTSYTSYKLSLGKWVTHSCRPMRAPQFLERGERDINKMLRSILLRSGRGGQTGRTKYCAELTTITASRYRARASRLLD